MKKKEKHVPCPSIHDLYHCSLTLHLHWLYPSFSTFLKRVEASSYTYRVRYLYIHTVHIYHHTEYLWYLQDLIPTVSIRSVCHCVLAVIWYYDSLSYLSDLIWFPP